MNDTTSIKISQHRFCCFKIILLKQVVILKLLHIIFTAVTESITSLNGRQIQERRTSNQDKQGIFATLKLSHKRLNSFLQKNIKDKNVIKNALVSLQSHQEEDFPLLGHLKTVSSLYPPLIDFPNCCPYSLAIFKKKLFY